MRIMMTIVHKKMCFLTALLPKGGSLFYELNGIPYVHTF